MFDHRPEPGDRPTVKTELTLAHLSGPDYQLGNWLVIPCRPLYLQVKDCLPLTVDDRHAPSQTVLPGTYRARCDRLLGRTLHGQRWLSLHDLHVFRHSFPCGRVVMIR